MNKVVNNLSKNNVLSDKQYGYHPVISTADVLTVMSHKISESIDGGFLSRAIALDIYKGI